LRSSLEQLTLSTDGASKETFEFYRTGARFEQVRDNYLRFCRLKRERGSKLQVVVQLVRMARNEAELGEFVRFWRAVPGVDQVRLKEDETSLMQPLAGHEARDWRHPCHYLWRGPLYVKHNGDVYPCCQSYALGGRPLGRIGDQPLPQIVNSEEILRMRRLHAERRSGEIDVCARCLIAIPHPLLVTGSLLLHGRTVRRALPVIERLALRRPGRWLRPPRKRP
jgi:radical SAM protein with 4Fe4S-binding SPASM domain